MTAFHLEDSSDLASTFWCSIADSGDHRTPPLAATTTVSDSETLAETAGVIYASTFDARQARQKFEIESLKEQAHALEEKLWVLQAASGAAYLPASRETLAILEASSALGWKSAARRQRGRLEASERENQKLRRTAVAQKKLAKSLQRLLLTRAAKSAVLSERLLRPQCDHALLREDHALFAELAADVDKLYASANVTLAILESGVPRSSTYHDWRVHCDVGFPARLDVVSCEEFPFPKTTVDSAIHALIHKETPGFRRYDASLFGGSADVMMTEFCGFKSDTTANYRQRRVSRSCESAARSTTVSVACVDSLDASGRPQPNLQLRVEMWIVRTQMRHESESGGATESTLIQNFTTITPTSPSLRRSQKLLEKHVVPLWELEISARVRGLERLLLAAA